MNDSFPRVRPRRLRRTEKLRRMVRETQVSVDDLVYPLFVVPGSRVRREICSLPGNYHFSVDMLPGEGEELARLGIPAVILFGLPEHKDDLGSQAWAPDGVVQRAVRELKRTVPDLMVVTDVCLCEFTSHGHCGVITDGCVDNDRTLGHIAQTALSHAASGADMVAPSDMMDGRVAAVRDSLDRNGFQSVPVMSYSAKYASAFYGPFREAAGSTPQSGDRRSYQMDPPNAREAVREALLDAGEGADIVMVKPALAYLDVISRVREAVQIPLAAYNVSGEFAMVKAAARDGLLDEKRAVLEILTGIKRAGADIILTYHARDAASWLMQA